MYRAPFENTGCRGVRGRVGRRARLGVVATDCRRDAVEIWEESAPVYSNEVELVAQPSHLGCGDDVLREGAAQPVVGQKGIERPRLVRAQCEYGRLRDDALIERWRLEKTREVALGTTPHHHPG